MCCPGDLKVSVQVLLLQKRGVNRRSFSVYLSLSVKVLFDFYFSLKSMLYSKHFPEMNLIFKKTCRA